MIQFSFDVSVIVLFGLHQPIRSSASGAALANQKLSCWVPLLLEQLWPIRSSASGAALANQKLSCWVPLGTVTGFHTKPPIMPYFSGFRSLQFIIQRARVRQAHCDYVPIRVVERLSSLFAILSENFAHVLLCCRFAAADLVRN